MIASKLEELNAAIADKTDISKCSTLNIATFIREITQTFTVIAHISETNPQLQFAYLGPSQPLSRNFKLQQETIEVTRQGKIAFVKRQKELQRNHCLEEDRAYDINHNVISPYLENNMKQALEMFWETIQKMSDGSISDEIKKRTNSYMMILSSIKWLYLTYFIMKKN
jgi:hypothetical protein